MATKKPTTDVESTETEQPIDLWSQKRAVTLLEEGFGENRTLYVAVNGRGMDVPVGEIVELPEPLAQVADKHNKAVRLRQAMYAQMRAEMAKNANYL